MGSQEQLNICLIGSGGVGTIAAVVLEKAGTKVTAVLRSKYAVVSAKGWDLESIDHGNVKGWKPTRGMCSIASLGTKNDHSLTFADSRKYGH